MSAYLAGEAAIGRKGLRRGRVSLLKGGCDAAS
jgi:hypothetical protein